MIGGGLAVINNMALYLARGFAPFPPPIIEIMKDTRLLSTLRNYEKNPRSIKKEDFERLKKHISDHGQMQPLVITEDGEVLGGNMRLRAYKEMGINDVWVEVVHPKDEADKLRIALVLNDRAGFYDGDLLANLIPDFPEFNWQDYSVDIFEPKNIEELVNIDFNNIESAKDREKQFKNMLVTCPHCQKSFEIKV